MNSVFANLVKREFWEHRALWMAPLIAAAVMVVLAVVAAVLGQGHINISGHGMKHASDPEALAVGVVAMGGPLFLVAGLTCTVFLLDCLYAERKDRSILFWKSLPVSDLHTVLAKFVVALLIVPVGVFVLSMLLGPVMYGIAALGLEPVGKLGWNAADWLRAEGWFSANLFATLLWFAPLAAWLMLASVLAKRAPMLIAVLPWLSLGVAESIVFRTAHVWKFLGLRFAPSLDPVETLSRPDLWIGLAVAAGMLYIVVRLRRYRDDT
jgi:ABC-2 type transport system permease protein